MRTASMSRDEVEKLPSFDYLKTGSKGSSPVDCAVCLDGFKSGDKCRLLPVCNHSFHADCVDEWLVKNPNCPICRSNASSLRFGDVEMCEDGVSERSHVEVADD